MRGVPGPIWFRSVCRENGLSITDAQLGKLEEFVRLLLHTNRSVNLISRKDEENVWENHILHSVSPLFQLSFPPGAECLDLGTGGGLPGVPLRIVLNVRFTLVDSIEKKTRALSMIVDKLGLSDVDVVRGRAEELGRKAGFRGAFDLVVSRAVAPLHKLVAWSEPLLRLRTTHERAPTPPDAKHRLRSGTLLAFKGGDIQKELSAARLRSPSIRSEEVPLLLKGSEAVSLAEKKLIIIQF